MDDLGYIVDKMLKIAKNDTKDKTKPYDAVGTVKRIDGDTAWVHFDNGVNETPVAKSINCKIGDKVHVRISNGNAFIVGNETAPPTDDTKAEHAQITADVAEKEAEQAKGLAQDASDTADHTAQYFWSVDGTGDEAGAHVTEVPQEAFESSPTGGNILLRSNSVKLRMALVTLAELTGTGLSIYELSDSTNPVAQFISSGAVIGKETNTNLRVDSTGVGFYNESTEEAFVSFDAGTGFNGCSIKTIASELRPYSMLKVQRGSSDARTYISSASNNGFASVEAYAGSSGEVDFTISEGNTRASADYGFSEGSPLFRISGKLSAGALISSLFDVTSHSTTSTSTAANTNRSGDLTLPSKPGYTPLGVVGFSIVSSSGANAGYANLIRCYLSARGDGSGTVTYVYRNTATSAMTAALTVHVLWLKTTA